jgi:hypothetical protein
MNKTSLNLVIILIIAALIVIGLSCNTGSSEDGVATTPTPVPVGEGLRLYAEGEQGPGDGIYEVTVVDSDVTSLQGSVYVQGTEIDWPSDLEWPSDYPPLKANQVLVLFMSSTDVDSYLYVDSGQMWREENPTINPVFGGTDVYYYSPGYSIVKFENVPITPDSTTILPDITLVPELDEWVFYTEEGAQQYK